MVGETWEGIFERELVEREVVVVEKERVGKGGRRRRTKSECGGLIDPTDKTDADAVAIGSESFQEELHEYEATLLSG